MSTATTITRHFLRATYSPDIYYLAFPSDSFRLKGVVYLAYIIETAQVVLATNDAFRQFASGWGDFAELNNMGLEWLTIKVSTGLIAILTQTFYAWRIYIG